ncbi:tetratricopeptide repeat protein [Thiomicrorhabdus sp.]|uniref:tetratricopeptide repeat protein n=1 Tax=Thiomicrorhabdus sp. TaxID=2039724 RepID=UPI0029C67B3D|nr:tetratricopeptide repeat protein [Thiomicrorhabdus sp.]
MLGLQKITQAGSKSRTVILALAALLFGGCSADGLLRTESSPSAAILSSKEVKQPLPELTEEQKERQKRAAAMYQVMLAEMLIRRGEPATAYEVMHHAAEQTAIPELAQRAFQFSMASYDIDKIQESIALWRKLDPNNAAVWRASFLLSLQQDKVEPAFEQWQKFRELSDLELEKLLLLTSQRVVASVATDAGVAFMQKLAEEYPKEWSVWVGLGLVAKSAGRLELSLDALLYARNKVPQDSEAELYRLLATVYLEGEHAKQGVDTIAPYLKKHPKDWELQEQMARLEVKANLLQSAEVRYQKIIKANPSLITPRLSLALLLIEREDYGKAEAQLKKTLTFPQYRDVSNYYLGVIYQAQAKYDEALKAFSKVLHPNYRLDADLHRSEILFSQGQVERANELLDSLDVKQVEDRIKVLRAKAIFATQQEQFDQAVDLYNQVLKIDPNHEQALASQAMVFYRTQRFDDYVDNMHRLLKLDPENVDALNGLGYFYVEQNKNLNQARTLLDKALQLEPDNYYVLDSMGWLLYRHKDFKQARSYLEKSFAIQQDEEVLIHLIRVYWQLGDHSKAERLWKKFHKQYGDNETFQKLIDSLKAGLTID